MSYQKDTEHFPTGKPPDPESESPGAVGTATGGKVRSFLEDQSQNQREQKVNVEPAAALRTAFKDGMRSRVMTRWFRVYDDLVDDPKVQRLDPPLFIALINLWCLTSANGGVLPPIDEIAFKLRMKPQRAQRVLDALKAAGLFEDDQTGTHPHNWAGRQHKSDVEDPTAAERMRRHRNRQRNNGVTRPATSRSPETDTEAEKTPSQGRMNSSAEAPVRPNGQRGPA
jgi:hypothetical protein